MGCCDNSNRKSPAASPTSNEEVRQTVRQGYAAIAQSHADHGVGLAVLGKGGCCGGAGGPTYTADQLAQQIGYGAGEIAQLPEGANMGLSCGNPTAIANLKPGQVVLDLGSGGGFDVFLAGPKVGPTGRVIGVDMTPEMLTKARKNIATYQQRTGLSNVEFRLGEIEHLPVADATVDVVISNCVINLSPDKPQVWREIARVLKPGGTVAASDMALLKPLPQSVAQLVEAMVGCVAGAVLLDQYRDMVVQAGLANITLRPKPEYVAALVQALDPLYQRIVAALPPNTQAGDFVTSVDVIATKP